MKHITFYLLIIFVVILFVGGCDRTETDTEQLLRTLTELQGQLEAHQSSEVLQHLDRDFIGQGRYRRAQLAQLIAFQFRQNRQIYVFLKNTQVNMRHLEADVVATAYVVGAKNILPERGQRYDVKMRWNKQKDVWKLSRLSWQRTVLD